MPKGRLFNAEPNSLFERATPEERKEINRKRKEMRLNSSTMERWYRSGCSSTSAFSVGLDDDITYRDN